MCHCGNPGEERTPNKSQHIKLTLEKRILPPLLPGLELTIFRSWVRRSYQQATPDPNNYRPVALTRCLCKTMERMVDSRLMLVLESKGLIDSEQCGSRKNQSTANHLIRFDSYVRNAFAKKRTCYCHFLWSGKSLRHHVETWYIIWSLRPWFSRPSAYLHWWVSIPPTVPGESLLHSVMRVSRRWVFPRVASYFRFFLVLKLTKV